MASHSTAQGGNPCSALLRNDESPFVYSIMALPMHLFVIFLSLASIAYKLQEDFVNKGFQLECRLLCNWGVTNWLLRKYKLTATRVPRLLASLFSSAIKLWQTHRPWTHTHTHTHIHTHTHKHTHTHTHAHTHTHTHKHAHLFLQATLYPWPEQVSVTLQLRCQVLHCRAHGVRVVQQGGIYHPPPPQTKCADEEGLIF